MNGSMSWKIFFFYKNILSFLFSHQLTHDIVKLVVDVFLEEEAEVYLHCHDGSKEAGCQSDGPIITSTFMKKKGKGK